MVTDPLGRVTGRLAEGEIGILDTTLAERIPATLFDRIGHWPFWIAVLGFMVAGAVTRRRPPRARA
jgi:apolipoprotein N-acyltransferase